MNRIRNGLSQNGIQELPERPAAERRGRRAGGARLSEARARQVIAHWRQRLGIRQAVRLERISRYQVTGEDGRYGCSLVGVVYDEADACIYHTRALTTEDVVHELLHVAHPDWSEEEVVAETAAILCRRGRRRRLRRVG